MASVLSIWRSCPNAVGLMEKITRTSAGTYLGWRYLDFVFTYNTLTNIRQTPSTTGNATSGSFLWSFKHSKVSTLYLTLVVVPVGQSTCASPTDICQLRYSPPQDNSLKHYFRRSPHQASIHFDWSNEGSSGGKLMLQLKCEDRIIPCERLNVRSDIPSVIKVTKCSDIEEAEWRATRVLKR